MGIVLGISLKIKSYFMKKLFFPAWIILLLGFTLLRHPVSSISGIITPSDAAVKVWAISSTDSFSTIPVAGKFNVPVKEGIYNLVVEATGPWQNALMSGIVVIDGQSNDVGTIVLKQKQNSFEKP